MTSKALAIVPATDGLTIAEDNQLLELEAVIKKNLRNFLVDVGRALHMIAEHRLYRAQFATFEEYLEERWGFKRTYGHYLVQGFQVTEELAQLDTGYPMPTAERQVRGLSEYEPDVQRALWKEACHRAGPGIVPSGRIVQEVIDELRAKLAPAGAKPARSKKAAPEVELDEDSEEEEDAHDPQGDEYFTPEKYVWATKALLGDIQLDPASCREANEVVGAKMFHTIEDDGLAQVWEAQTAFLNPPYSRGLVDRFVGKLVNAYKDGRVKRAILVVNACTSSEWFDGLHDFPICWVKGRVKFRKPRAVLEAEAEKKAQAKAKGEKYEPPSAYGRSATAIVYLAPEDDWNEFAYGFRKFGKISVPLPVAEEFADE